MLEELAEMLIITVCVVWATLSIFNSWVVRKFIFSKPPGRKMITADINAIGFIFGNMIPVVLCVGVSLRTLFDTFPVFGVFIMTEATIVPFSFLLGVYNVAAVFNVILIFYPRSVIAIYRKNPAYNRH